jgi:release factor glutamine methyltransferase
MAPQVWTIMDVLNWTTNYLKSGTSSTPRLDAELLLAYVLEVERIRLYVDHDKPMMAPELARFKGLVRQRKGGESVAHITGQKEFWKLRFETPAPLFVPRPETELLVEEAVRMAGESGQILDLCCGTGAILVSVVHELPGWQGVGVDQMPLAAKTATQNAENAGVADRVTVHCDDAVAFVASSSQPQFSMITCNPPYVASAEWEMLAPEIKVNEPRQAVDGGSDGLDLLRRLLPELPARLAPGGRLLLEYGGDDQSAVLSQLLVDTGFANVKILKDYGGIDRVAVATVLS